MTSPCQGLPFWENWKCPKMVIWEWGSPTSTMSLGTLVWSEKKIATTLYIAQKLSTQQLLCIMARRWFPGPKRFLRIGEWAFREVFPDVAMATMKQNRQDHWGGDGKTEFWMCWIRTHGVLICKTPSCSSRCNHKCDTVSSLLINGFWYFSVCKISSVNWVLSIMMRK